MPCVPTTIIKIHRNGSPCELLAVEEVSTTIWPKAPVFLASLLRVYIRRRVAESDKASTRLLTVCSGHSCHDHSGSHLFSISSPTSPFTSAHQCGAGMPATRALAPLRTEKDISTFYILGSLHRAGKKRVLLRRTGVLFRVT